MFHGQTVVPVVSVQNGIINFNNHILSSDGPGCVGARNALTFSGDHGLFTLGFTGGANQRLGLYRNCVSIVTVRRTKFRGAITTLNATFPSRRVRLVTQCTSHVGLVFSTSNTKRGTARQTVSGLHGANLSIQIIAVPSNGSPSRFLGGGNSTTVQLLLRQSTGTLRCHLLRLKGGRGLAAPSNGITCVGRTTNLLTSLSDPIRRSICTKQLTRRLSVHGRFVRERMRARRGHHRQTTHGQRLPGLVQQRGGSVHRIGPRTTACPGKTKTRRYLLNALLVRPSCVGTITTALSPRRFIATFGHNICTHLLRHRHRKLLARLTFLSTSCSRSNVTCVSHVIQRTKRQTTAPRSTTACTTVVHHRRSLVKVRSPSNTSSRSVRGVLRALHGRGRWVHLFRTRGGKAVP